MRAANCARCCLNRFCPEDKTVHNLQFASTLIRSLNKMRYMYFSYMAILGFRRKSINFKLFSPVVEKFKHRVLEE